MKRTLLSMSLLAISLSSFAQLSMVSDINPGNNGSSPSRLTVFGNKLVYLASDGFTGSGTGTELWTLDSNGAPLMVYNINPGTASGGTNAAYFRLAVAQGKLYFPANNGTHGSELFSWDGSNPPVMVKDIYPGPNSSNITDLVTYNNKVYFGATDVALGQELFEYDPAQNKTTLVKDIIVGAGSSSPQGLVVYNNKLYFVATDAVAGRELHVYDDVTKTTKLVADINVGANSSGPLSMVVVGGRMYFSATEPLYGRELYSLTDTLVQRHTDLWAGGVNSLPIISIGQLSIGSLNNVVYFNGNDGSTGSQLYKFDPKSNTASLAYNINPLGNSNPFSFTRFNNKLYFSATDGTNGNELWAYDGMNAPAMVANIDTNTSLSSNPLGFTVLGDALYFSASESTTGNELYMYKDPTLGIQNVRFNADVKVYPNPATATANVEMVLKNNENLNISLHDITGREVFKTGYTNYVAGKTVVTLPMQSLNAGVYIYSITSSEGKKYYTGRLVKQ